MLFDNLSTVQFAKQLRPSADIIYKQTFDSRFIPSVELSESGILLDKQLGIDGVLKFSEDGSTITIQEKFRTNDALKYGDVTFEIRNGDGTPGEYLKLAAQLYFYGWADSDGKGFADWLVINVPALKLLVHQSGGIQHVGQFHRNCEHGRSKFVSVPLEFLEPAIVKRADLSLKSAA